MGQVPFVVVLRRKAAVRPRRAKTHDGTGRNRVQRVQHAERPARQPQREHVDDRAHRVLAHEAVAPADAERERAVGLRVRDRGDRERDGVRAGGAERATQCEEEDRVGDRRYHADGEEARQTRSGKQPRDAAQVGERRRHDVDARVRVVDPVHRHLVDP
jgi:hypothetical protein